MSLAVYDMKINPWPDEEGGAEAQARSWRDAIQLTGENYPGELAELYAYLDEQGIEIQGSAE